MGCGASGNDVKSVKINVQPKDKPVKIRLRIRGDIPNVNSDMIEKELITLLGCSPQRLDVSSSEKVDVYFAILKPDVGDEPGTVRRFMKQIVGAATGKGILIEDKVKIIGAKEYLEVADLE